MLSVGQDNCHCKESNDYECLQTCREVTTWSKSRKENAKKEREKYNQLASLGSFSSGNAEESVETEKTDCQPLDDVVQDEKSLLRAERNTSLPYAEQSSRNTACRLVGIDTSICSH